MSTGKARQIVYAGHKMTAVLRKVDILVIASELATKDLVIRNVNESKSVDAGKFKSVGDFGVQIW